MKIKNLWNHQLDGPCIWVNIHFKKPKKPSPKKSPHLPKPRWLLAANNPRSFTEPLQIPRTFLPTKRLKTTDFPGGKKHQSQTTSHHLWKFANLPCGMGKKFQTSSPWVWMVMTPMLQREKKITEKKTQMARNYQRSQTSTSHLPRPQPDVFFFSPGNFRVSSP